MENISANRKNYESAPYEILANNINNKIDADLYSEFLDMEVISNRVTKKVSYKSIQKKYNLKQTVTYNTPDACTSILETRIQKHVDRYLQLSDEVF